MCSLTLDGLEDLSNDSRTLFFQEPLELLPYRVDVVDPEELLYPFDYDRVALSELSRQQEMTHAMIAS
jgi:hypothetical protein